MGRQRGLDIRQIGFHHFGLIAQIPVTLQPLLQAGGRFADGRARYADQARAPSASSILKGFALPVCASRFRPMVKTYILCPDVTPLFLIPRPLQIRDIRGS